MSNFFNHKIHPKGSQAQNLTSIRFFAYPLIQVLKKTIGTILLLLIFSCEIEETISPIQDPCQDGTNSNSNLVSKIPHQIGKDSRWFTFGYSFYGLSEDNHFLFGSPFIGTGPAKSEDFEVKVMNHNGQTLWHHYLAHGQTTLGAFVEDKIMISGWIRNMDGTTESVSKIFDENGQELIAKIHDQIVFRDHYLDHAGNLYLSNTSKSFESNPTEIIKLSSTLEIEQHYVINYPVQSFIANQDGEILAFYSDDSTEENGLIMLDQQGQEKWKTSLPSSYRNEGRLVQINNQKYGLIKTECPAIPCATEIMYYEFGANGELINSVQTIASSITLDMLINNPADDKNNFYIDDRNRLIKDVVVLEEEVLVVFAAFTKNHSALMIKGTLGSSLEHWWGGESISESTRSLSHIQLTKNDGGLEWKTFCGQAICTFELLKNLQFNS